MLFEEWRRLPSDPSLLVSSLGRVMVATHFVPMPRGGKKPVGGNPTYGQWDGARFIYARRGHKTRKVARMVCEAFNGQPTDGAVCMHLNENASDNRPENLRWGTQQENLNAPGFIAYCKSRTGDDNPHRKGRQ